jgi:hypothetical protein
MLLRIALAACCALLMLAPTAQAQLPTPQTDFSFGSTRPNTSTGFELEVGTEQGGAGPSLEAFTLTLPLGTDIDDGFIPNCGLSLQQFLTTPGGANRCPSSSLIGEVELVLNYSNRAIPPIDVEFNLYNTPGAGFAGTFPVGLIVGGATGNYVVNGVFRGPTSQSGGPRMNLNSIPGPPPPNADGIPSAYSFARVELYPAARGRSDFIVTPGRCFPNVTQNAGAWNTSTSILVSGGAKSQDGDSFTCTPPPSNN